MFFLSYIIPRYQQKIILFKEIIIDFCYYNTIIGSMISKILQLIFQDKWPSLFLLSFL
jgi:hypothetical protein